MPRRALRPLDPGVRLMRRLRVPAKLALMGLVMLVPMMLFVAKLYLDSTAQIDAAKLELVGARQISLLADTVTGLQAHRDAASRGGGRDPALLTRIEGRLARLDDRAAPLLTPEPATWNALRQAVADLAQGRAPERRDELFAFHGHAIELAARQMQLTAEASGLLLDPDAASYYLMDLAAVRLVPWLEALSAARGQGAAIMARGEASRVERTAMLSRAETIERATADVQLRLDSLARHGRAIPPDWAKARQASEQLVERIRGAFSAQAIADESGPYFDLATGALDAGASLEQGVVDTLVAELAQRVQKERRELAWHVGLAALGALTVGYLALSFYFSFAGAVRALHRGVEKMLGGDLSQRITVQGRDELAEIGTMVERMNERLSTLVAEIRSSAVRVSMSGETVASGSQSLAARTEQQAASLREAVVTVRHLSSAVAANAEEAARLDALTSRLRDQAEASAGEMHDSIAAMAALEDSSRRVGEIIGVIDSIAFQTNILALNAAVEAARAGDAGRGFAVVAAEVRQLAQRSAAAAGEIRTLIARSSEEVDVSVRRTREVGDVLTSLVDGVRKVSQSLQAIAQASSSHSGELQHVSASVGNLDEITQRNAEMVGRSNDAASDLVERAGALRQSVAMIRLRQGSADEARALVERAFALVRDKGMMAAHEPLHSSDLGFVDRDLYVFVVDREGRYVVHGAKPAMEGRRVHEVPGIDGDRFVREAWAAATAHGGAGSWVEYDIVNPGTGEVQPKASFVRAIDDSRLIGCGIYRVGSMVAA